MFLRDMRRFLYSWSKAARYTPCNSRIHRRGLHASPYLSLPGEQLPLWTHQAHEVAGMLQANIRFEEFELDVEGCELRRAGRPIRLERLPMELLLLLLEHPGKMISRDVINQRLWGNDVFVDTGPSINTAVNKLRSVFRDDSRNPRFIRTVVGQGYCFIAKVSIQPPIE